jgi:glutamine---fructose-6-phosphate transaminase (isomerizing)
MAMARANWLEQPMSSPPPDPFDLRVAISNPEFVGQIGINDTSGRCISCLIPDHIKNIQFKDGVCSLCAACSGREAGKRPQAMEGGLEDCIESIRTRGRRAQYDCLLGLSGGRDSTYLAHLLVRKHGLRVLAAYYRTPFTHDVTDQNVRRTVQALGMTLVNLDIDPKRHADIARKFFLMWLKRPLPELANLTCAECKLVNRELARLAKLHNVRTIVCGGTRIEKVQFLPAARKEGERAEALWANTRRTCRIAMRGAGVIRRCPSVLTLLPTCVKASVMYINTHTPYLKLQYPRMEKLDYFNYAKWSETECLATIRREFDWQVPPECLGTWKTDCAFGDLKNWMFHRMFGATYQDCMLSNMVRDEQLTRQEAIDRIAGQPIGSPTRIAESLRVMGLPVDILKEVNLLKPASRNGRVAASNSIL